MINAIMLIASHAAAFALGVVICSIVLKGMVRKIKEDISKLVADTAEIERREALIGAHEKEANK